MARPLADEDFPRPVALRLRRLGHDVETAVTAGFANLEWEDPDVLATATRDERILLTCNRQDYVQLHRAGVPHTGIIVSRHDSDWDRLAANIHHALEQNPEMRDRLLRVYRNSTVRRERDAASLRRREAEHEG